MLWNELQPTGRDHWNQAFLDDFGKTALHNRGHGVGLLPILVYTAPWAARRSAWSFTIADANNNQWSPWRQGDIRYDVPAVNHNEARPVNATNLKTGQTTTLRFGPQNFRTPDTATPKPGRFLHRLVSETHVNADKTTGLGRYNRS